MDLIVLDDHGGDIEAGLLGNTITPMKEENHKLYVAVGKEVRESESLLLWAIQNSGGRMITILHVHQPDEFIPILGKKFHWSSLEEKQVNSYRRIEKQLMLRTLDEYLDICRQFEVDAEKLYIEMDSIEIGMLQLISQHNIEKLVMGAASDHKYHAKLMEPKSKKAIYLQSHAPISCQMWFICKGHLVHQRDCGSQVKIHPENETSASSITLSMMGQNNEPAIYYPNLQAGGGASHSESGDGWITDFPSTNNIEFATGSQSQLDLETNCLDCTEPRVLEISRESASHVNHQSTIDPLEFLPGRYPKQIHHHPYSPPPTALLGSDVNEGPGEQLRRAMHEAKHSTRVAIDEVINRRDADAEAEAVLRAQSSSESSYVEEVRKRQELEVELVTVKNDNEWLREQLVTVKNDNVRLRDQLVTVKKDNERLRDQLVTVKNDNERLREQLQIVMNQNSVLESKVMNYELVVRDLEEGMISNVELLQVCEKERDDLKVERDNVLRTAEELVHQSTEAASITNAPTFFSTLTFSEIKEATNDFDPLLQLWEGENGSLYRGDISHAQVTIRMWHPEGPQGPQEFHQEVEILSKFRHPNLITLMGVCPEACALVYEYLPNGSLEERLNCEDNTPPLSWQTRIRIATELCSALIFLHTRMPRRVIHGSLKSSCVLLDSNFSCKISDFGCSHLIPYSENSHSELSSSSRYIDPEFFMTGEGVNPALDIYSFGMILLELLTGKHAFGVSEVLEDALEGNYVNTLLDRSAGDWPFVQAEQLARLALRCCAEDANDRPDFETEIWRVLEPMRASCGSSSSYNLGDDEQCQAPSYFICPILQEVMKDPHIAADGYTYEAEALKAWLDSGHDTSPMTNLQLEHCNLVPNHALRSVIQEWQQRRSEATSGASLAQESLALDPMEQPGSSVHLAGGPSILVLSTNV